MKKLGAVIVTILFSIGLFAQEEFKFKPNAKYTITYQVTANESKSLQEYEFLKIVSMKLAEGSNANKVLLAEFTKPNSSLRKETVLIALDKIVEVREIE